MSQQIRLPAEWEPQSGVMLTWPHAHNDWGDTLPAVEDVFAALAQQISQRERVLIVCFDAQHRTQIRGRLENSPCHRENLRYALAPSNDVWARDHGPITVIDGGTPSLLDFTFNGWDNKFSAALDNQITLKLANQRAWGEHSVRPVNLVLEGGAIESDGKGTLMLTTSCLLESRRNPHLNQAGMEQQLATHLGATNFHWLRHGHLAGDDTDGHIDTLARFCDTRTIAYVACDDPQDEHYPELLLMKAELEALRDADNQPYNLVALPLPGAKYHEHVQRLPATYANFLILNDAVLVPTYDDKKDQLAIETLASCFPGRQIIGINCLPLIQQYGSLHCVTMQLPSDVLN